ncbi:MAG: hypothetical protein WC250_03660 [Candidatus Paceibacterota bacterium]|jgi:hypothetical protein
MNKIWSLFCSFCWIIWVIVNNLIPIIINICILLVIALCCFLFGKDINKLGRTENVELTRWPKWLTLGGIRILPIHLFLIWIVAGAFWYPETTISALKLSGWLVVLPVLVTIPLAPLFQLYCDWAADHRWSLYRDDESEQDYRLYSSKGV